MERFELVVGRWYWAIGRGLVKLIDRKDRTVESLDGLWQGVPIGELRELSTETVDRQEVLERVKFGWLDVDALKFWQVRRANGFGSDVFREPT